jgi:heme exporter protein D
MWSSWAEFWSMGGRGSYVWGSYGLVAVLVVAEIIAVRLRGKQARANLALQKARSAKQAQPKVQPQHH